jgi:arylsulfatase A-like enzyme
MKQPNILFIMTDQQRFDTIASLDNEHIYTPNMDRLVNRGLSFSNGYTTCPVCMPTRITIRTGCNPPRTGVFNNSVSHINGSPDTMDGRCGPYLATTMANRGYRTFGIGKFHSAPMWNEALGYETHLHSEEIHDSIEIRQQDNYGAWIAKEHPEYDYIEDLMGERAEMYYVPQTSAMPADVTVERWAADRAVEMISDDDSRPYFGFVSFVGPHPPFAPPIPFNRIYDPDLMPSPIKGDPEIDLMDEQIPWMNYKIWAEDISDPTARTLKARYYGEITYIDDCLGKILDAVEAREDADNTLICFFSDHGDHLGDHHAWQKETIFESSCRVPFLVSWPDKLAMDEIRDELVCLTDLFAIATGASGEVETRDGIDLLRVVEGDVNPRQVLFGCTGIPGTPQFKIMVRESRYKGASKK